MDHLARRLSFYAFFLSFLLLTASSQAIAQSYSTVIESDAFKLWFDHDQFAPSKANTVSECDNCTQSVSFPEGFQFRFYSELYGSGTSQSSLWVSSNGFVSLNSSNPGASPSSESIDSQSVPPKILAPLWGDLKPQLGGDIFYFSPTPNIFVIEFSKIKLTPGLDDYIDFQIGLHKNSDKITYAYRLRAPSLKSLPFSASIGMTGDDPKKGQKVSICDGNCISQEYYGVSFVPADADSDGFSDYSDNCKDKANHDQVDADFDGVGDLCDNCPQQSNSDQADSDSDRTGDACDNCASTANSDQENWDNDQYGNACDNCLNVANNDQTDTDSDAHGDVCDNCPSVANSEQNDSDDDSVGDACDNCPEAANTEQTDANSNGVGDACDEN